MRTGRKVTTLVGMIPLGEAKVEIPAAVEEIFLPEAEILEEVETRVIPTPPLMVILTPPFLTPANF